MTLPRGSDDLLTFLARLTAASTAALSLPDFLEHALQALRDWAGLDSCSVAVLDEHTSDVLVIYAASGLGAGSRGRQLPRGTGPYEAVMATRTPLVIPDVAADPRIPKPVANIRSGIYAPLVVRGRAIGVLSAERSAPGTLTPADLSVLTIVAGSLAATIEVARLHERLEDLSATDGLTGLANHRSLHEALEREVARAERFQQAVSVILVDIDDFTQFNNRYGHVRGDELLRTVGDVLRGACRQMDLVARFGGDEFAVILPLTFKHEVGQAAERLRRRVEEISLLREDLYLTVSIGASSMPEDGTTADALLQAAGRAAALAQETGNRVEVA